MTEKPPTSDTLSEPAPGEAALRPGDTRIGVRRCYREALKEQPELKGKLTVKVDIDASGAVSSASLVGPGIEPTLDACVLEVIRRVHFKPAGGPVSVTYPIVLSGGQ